MGKGLISVRLFILLASIAIFTNLFSLVAPITIGPLNNFNIGFILMFLSSFSLKYFVFSSNFFKIYYLFLISILVSFSLTLFKGYSLLNSMKVFALVLPYFCLPPLVRFCETRVPDKLISSGLNIMQILAFVISLLYIIQAITNIQIFAEYAKTGVVEGTDVLRSLHGYPEILPFFLFYTLYLVIENKRAKDILILITLIFATFLTYTRGLIISLLFTSFYLILITKSATRFFKYFISIFFLILCFYLIFPDNFHALISRFQEIAGANSIEDIRNLEFRYLAFLERLKLFFHKGFLFGVGFIHQNESTNFGLIYSKKLINDDIFYSNMFVLFGAVGSIFFLSALIILIKMSFKGKNNIISFSFLGFLLYLFLISFSAGTSFIHGSFFFVIFSAIFLSSRRDSYE